MAMQWAHGPVLTAPNTLNDEALLDWLVEQRMDEVVCAYLPMGPTRIRVERLCERLASKGIGSRIQMRDYDRFVWLMQARVFSSWVSAFRNFWTSCACTKRPEVAGIVEITAGKALRLKGSRVNCWQRDAVVGPELKSTGNLREGFDGYRN